MNLIHFCLKKNDGHVIKHGIARIFSEILLTIFYISLPPPLLHVLQIILMPFRRYEICFFQSVRPHNHCSKSSGSTRSLLSHVENRGKRRIMLLKINLAKLERSHMGDSTIFSIFCSRTALFCVCVFFCHFSCKNVHSGVQVPFAV